VQVLHKPKPRQGKGLNRSVWGLHVKGRQSFKRNAWLVLEKGRCPSRPWIKSDREGKDPVKRNQGKGGVVDSSGVVTNCREEKRVFQSGPSTTDREDKARGGGILVLTGAEQVFKKTRKRAGSWKTAGV